MENQKFKTKLQLIEELGISKAAFYRRLKKQNIKLTPELLCPKTEHEIRLALGFRPLEGIAGQIETD